MSNQKRTVPKNSGKYLKDLHSYAETLRDTSFLFEEKIEELSVLKRIGDIVGYIFEQEIFCRKLLDILLEETNADNASLMLLDENQRLVLKMGRGKNDEGTFFECLRDSETTFFLGEGVAGKAAQKKETILINDVSQDTRFIKRKTWYPIGSLISAPLIFQGKVLGVINLSNTQAHAFRENNKRALELMCAFVSVIIGNASTYIKARDQEKFKAMFEGVRFAILLLDAESLNILEANKFTEEWLGYGKEELILHKHIADIAPPEYREQLRYMLHQIREKYQSGFYELPLIKKDGSTTIAEMSGELISYQEKNVIQLTLRDITEKKEIEEKLIRSEKLRALGEMAGGIAHDFNNFLAAILGRVQLVNKFLQRTDALEKRKSIYDIRKSLETIEKAALDGAETVRRIQEFSLSKVEHKYPDDVDLNKIIDDVIKFTKVRWKSEAEAKGITITISKETTPLPKIKGSASELREVLTNLVNNAIDAMPQGGILSLKTFKKNRHIVITVKDTGIGIPRQLQEKIFDPFFTTKGPQSNGLGLSVSYGIISRHGGTIKVESTKGKETTFTITFPLSFPKNGTPYLPQQKPPDPSGTHFSLKFSQ